MNKEKKRGEWGEEKRSRIGKRGRVYGVKVLEIIVREDTLKCFEEDKTEKTGTHQ
jgi:hypothetical protein